MAKRALVADPAKAHQDMLRLVSRMSIPKNIPPSKAAFNITIKPREADIIQPYKKGSYTSGPKPGPSGSKRPRMDKDKDNQSECPASPEKRRPTGCRFPCRVDSAGPVSPTCN